MTTPTLLHRTTCACCNGGGLESFYTTPAIPAFQGCVTSPVADDVAAPQNWASCPTCGSVMLLHMMPLDLIYMAAHATSLGGVWDEHHAQLAAFVAKHAKGAILEVGGGVGKLAHYFRKAGHPAPWTILEANPLPPETPIENLRVEKGLFGTDYAMPDDHSLVFSHCLEHILNVGDMVETIAQKLPLGGRHIVAWPQIEAWLPQGLPGALNWEHTFYVPIETLICLHARHGLVLVEHKKFKDHSHFLAFERGAPQALAWESNLAPNNRQAVQGYWDIFKTRVAALNARLASSPKPHYLMPASVYSQYLVAFGLDTSAVAAVLDDAPVKQTKRLYGTPLTVQPSSTLAQTGGSVVINGGSHTTQIMQNLGAMRPDAALLNAIEF